MVLLRVLGSVACTVLGVTGAVAGYSATAGGTGTAAPVVAAQEAAVEQSDVRVSLRDCPDRLELRAGACVRVLRRTVVTWVTPAAVPLTPTAVSPAEPSGPQTARPTRAPGHGPTPTASPSASPSAEPSATPPSPTPPAPTPSCPGGTSGAEPTGLATEPSDPPTESPSAPACPSASPTPSASPSPSPSGSPGADPSNSPSGDPTGTPSSTPSSSAEPTPARVLTGG